MVTKRRIFKFCGFILAGAIVNVAVAWGCAMWSPFRLMPVRSPPMPGLPITSTGEGFGVEIVAVGAQVTDMSCGWPARSLKGRLWLGKKVQYLTWLNSDHAVASRALWPGFAINTVFYAAVLWVLVAGIRGPGFIRRRIRIKRGLCPSCGYPIGSNPRCTECGKPVRAKGAEPAES